MGFIPSVSFRSWWYKAHSELLKVPCSGYVILLIFGGTVSSYIRATTRQPCVNRCLGAHWFPVFRFKARNVSVLFAGCGLTGSTSPIREDMTLMLLGPHASARWDFQLYKWQLLTVGCPRSPYWSPSQRTCTRPSPCDQVITVRQEWRLGCRPALALEAIHISIKSLTWNIYVFVNLSPTVSSESY
jgi:hypothetical protein